MPILKFATVGHCTRTTLENGRELRNGPYFSLEWRVWLTCLGMLLSTVQDSEQGMSQKQLQNNNLNRQINIFLTC